MAGMVNNLNAQFTRIHYFPVSAMGHEANSEVYEPWGVMESVSWIIQENPMLVEILAGK
jgi:hypothetical protein